MKKWILFGLSWLFANFSQAQSLTWLGVYDDRSEIGSNSRGLAVSSFGHVVGHSQASLSRPGNAFIYYNGVMQRLCVQPCDNGSIATGISANGEVIAGAHNQPGTNCSLCDEVTFINLLAVRWHSGQLGYLASRGCESYADDVSDDGSVVVGWTQVVPNCHRIACFWRGDSGPTLVGTLGGDSSEAYGVSASGEVIVGQSKTSSGQYHAFVWTPTSGISSLPTALATESKANAVSSDGTVIVGTVCLSDILNDCQAAVRWRKTTDGWILERLEVPQGLNVTSSEAKDVSNGGTIIVGTFKRIFPNANSSRAFIWTLETGMQDLNDLYSSLLNNGSFLETAEAISPDGRFITGRGFHCTENFCRWEAYLLDTLSCVPNNGDIDGDGCVDDADLLAVISSWGNPTNCPRCDTNCDGRVDDADLLEVLSNWGRGC